MAGETDPYRPDVPSAKEFEVTVAELENRLRGTMLRILQPSLTRTSDLASEVYSMRQQISKNTEALDSVIMLREEVAKQEELVTVIRDELQQRAGQDRLFQTRTSGEMAELRQAKVEVNDRADELKADLEKMQREMARVWEETERQQKQHEEASRKVWEDMGAAARKNEGGRTEIHSRLSEMDKRHDALVEELYGEDKGLTKLRADHQALVAFVKPLPELQKELTDNVSKTTKLDERQDQVTEQMRRTKEGVDNFQGKVEKDVAGLHEEFRTTCNKLTAHHASLMRDVRLDYAEEINLAKGMREKVLDFQSDIREYVGQMSDALTTESRRVDALHKALLGEMEELNKKRKKDRTVVDSELKLVRKDLGQQHDTNHVLHTEIEYVGRMVGLLLEAERAGSAMSIQDFADRKTVHFLALPDELTAAKPQVPQTALTLAHQRKLEGDAGHQPPNDQVVQVNWRQGLAELSYRPGEVSFGGTKYDRRDLLLMQSKLLEKAHAVFKKGPARMLPPRNTAGAMNTSGAAITATQPTANGGASADEIAFDRQWSSLKSMDDPKPPVRNLDRAADKADKSAALGGGWAGNRPVSQGRQRPGSQGQPQAMGSRGTMECGLGETSPPGAPGGGRSSPPPVRLPTIERNGAMSARGSLTGSQPAAGSDPVDLAFQPHTVR
eukprot:gnl/TRDRNA2_/TRDRNA2_136785_c0_seq1.p1 gnl/TRDRNA2_/TRDRNA2_136785_c0~~gnl/TRDRNA2_/TRDRNA2_136785_c0_seq1.p1  ORF type:complete len:669 (+),score=133.65 gnl/TRDRNA2_/TRDRNA2_136785_c0_seq1:85-2091(+)